MRRIRLLQQRQEVLLVAGPLCSGPAPSSSPFLRAAGRLKAADAREALTISKDGCWVISGEEVSSRVPSPQRATPHPQLTTQAHKHEPAEPTNLIIYTRFRRLLL